MLLNHRMKFVKYDNETSDPHENMRTHDLVEVYVIKHRIHEISSVEYQLHLTLLERIFRRTVQLQFRMFCHFTEKSTGCRKIVTEHELFFVEEKTKDIIMSTTRLIIERENEHERWLGLVDVRCGHFLIFVRVRAIYVVEYPMK